MFNIDEIIKLKNEGFTAEDIVELSKIKADEPKEESKKFEETKEESKVEEKQKEESNVDETKESKKLEEKNPISDLNSFNDKMDELIEQIKKNNIAKQYIETPKEMTGMDILANVINPKTKEVIK